MKTLALFTVLLSSLVLAPLRARCDNTLPAPGQPFRHGIIGGFEIIGNSLVSAQQLFLGTADKVYFVDKVENNPAQINGHPAWAEEWALASNAQRPMEVVTNSFCAGGSPLGNGTWLNVGGNQPVTFGGLNSDTGNTPPYFNPDGRNSIRMLNPCDDGNCDWVLSPTLSDLRWYPTLETLEDGTMIIIGGCTNGGYVNNAAQDNPTYQFFPSLGPSVPSPVLSRTLPVNLYPLTWLLPSGRLLIQSNWETVLLNYKTNEETPLDNMPDAVRVYPASAGTVMLPLTPANNYTATILFCGGSNISPDKWTAPGFIAPSFPASTSCVTLSPDSSSSYRHDDPLPDARVMTSFIALPNGKILNVNGAKMGTAGYGNDSWAIGHSYADNPVLKPAIYDPQAPSGSRWSSAGLLASTIPRMYHSTAVLLPDGSVMISGSNPNPDYTVGPDVEYPTEYRTELFYPSYYNERRPQPQGLLGSYTYGGSYFNIFLDAEDLLNDLSNVNKTKVVIIRPGFSTHCINMGQRYVELPFTYTGDARNVTSTLHVSQLPPNPSIIAPGPALIFVVVNGIPSVGVKVMLGSGQLGAQQVLEVQELPLSTVVTAATSKSSDTTKSSAATSGSMCSTSFVIGLFGLMIQFLTLWT